MNAMFSGVIMVRYARALAQPRLARPFHICIPWLSLLSILGQGSAFNQPLSFDTSKVTNINYMFDVS